MSGKCPVCGQGELKTGVVELERVVAGKSFTAKAQALVCGECAENFVSDEALEAFELAIASKLASGPADGPGFKFMRRVLGLRGADLAQLLQVSLETISRWETGKRAVDHRGFALLGLLVKERAAGRSDIMSHLERLAQAPKEHGFDLGLISPPPS